MEYFHDTEVPVASSPLKKTSSTLYMKFLHFFCFLSVILVCLDRDLNPDPKHGGGVIFPRNKYNKYGTGSVADPDPGSGIGCFLTPGS